MLVIKFIITSYLIIYFSVIFHELGHLLAAIIFGLKHYKIRIGKSKYIINAKRVSISPLLSASSVEMNLEEILGKKPYEIILIFLAGPLCSLFTICFAMIMEPMIYKVVFIVFNLVMVIISLTPFVRGSDLYQIRKILKLKARNNQ